MTGQLKSIAVTITSANQKGFACTYTIQRRHRSACGDGFGTATVFCNFQCRGVHLIWIIVEYKGSMCLQQVRAGRGVSWTFSSPAYIFCLFFWETACQILSRRTIKHPIDLSSLRNQVTQKQSLIRKSLVTFK